MTYLLFGQGKEGMASPRGDQPSGISPVLGAFLRRCLVKKLQQRIHDMADVRLALDGVFDIDTPRAAQSDEGWLKPMS